MTFSGHHNQKHTDQFRRESLARHNLYRRRHGVPDLVLSARVSQVAQRYAEHLARTDTFQHSQGSGFGENLYYSWSSSPNTVISGNSAVDSWYSEVSKYNYGRPGFSFETGHFTQVVWKSSRELGVGAARSRSGKVYVVANYSPPGNYLGQFPANVLHPTGSNRKG